MIEGYPLLVTRVTKAATGQNHSGLAQRHGAVLSLSCGPWSDRLLLSNTLPSTHNGGWKEQVCGKTVLVQQGD